MSHAISRAVSTAQILAPLLAIFCWMTGDVAQAAFVEVDKWQGPGPYGAFGAHTALSKSGDVAVVGFWNASPGECPRVFRRNPATNQWQAEVIQEPPTCPNAGAVAVLAGNGGVVVIIDRLARYVRSYLFNGTAWQLEHTLGPIGQHHSAFGYDAALSHDGSTLIVSSHNNPSYEPIFHELKRTASGWSLVQTVVPGSGGIHSLAASADLQHLAIATGEDAGTVRIWRRNGAAWVLTSTLPGSVGGDGFGSDVAMSEDGSTLLVAEQRSYDCAPTYCSTVHVYVRQGTSWFWHQQLVLPVTGEPTGIDPGYLALSSSGGLAVVGDASGVGCGPTQCGAVYLFRRQGLAWHHEQTLLSTSGPFKGYLYGTYVAVAGNAGTLLIGAPYYECGPNQRCGAAYLYEFDSTPPCSGPVMPPGCFEILMPAFGQTPFVPLGCEIIDCCPLCPAAAEVEWALTLDGAPVRELVVRLERLDAQQLARLRLRGPAQWVAPGLLRIMPGGEVTVSGFSVPRATLRWSVASPRMTFHGVVGANPGPGEIRLRVEQRTPQGRLGETVLVYRLTGPPP